MYTVSDKKDHKKIQSIRVHTISHHFLLSCMGERKVPYLQLDNLGQVVVLGMLTHQWF